MRKLNEICPGSTIEGLNFHDGYDFTNFFINNNTNNLTVHPDYTFNLKKSLKQMQPHPPHRIIYLKTDETHVPHL